MLVCRIFGLLFNLYYKTTGNTYTNSKKIKVAVFG